MTNNSPIRLCYKWSLWKVQKPQACTFTKRETLAQVFSCEFCEISKNTFFQGTPPVAASECSLSQVFWTNFCKPNIETLQNKFTWKNLKFWEMLDLKTPINSSEKNWLKNIFSATIISLVTSAITQRWSVKKLFLKISQNFQKKVLLSVFNKVADCRPVTSINRNSDTSVFLWILQTF